ncbi:low molecular weight protein-tyrosine-phosphatase [uncultured Reyranella sp.]|uniref:low molecular weight protein-tyrosine-phosphatase n=1 Tax=uncultured Reyranella sp. TaxID=735512 RepID=UPI0025E8BADB|nr:low molecular weight protein-tyrosine-phosphatase [uncultured Reyranella sp.]
MTIRVLFVSTGGTCRAPMAVGTLRAIVARAGLSDLFEIDGAATYEGHTDQPPSLLAIEAAARRGYPIRDLRARPLATEDMAHFDYPLAMDRTHLAAMRWLAPSRLTERPQMFLKYAPALGVRDIQDPFGGTNEDFERALDLIEAGCVGLLKHLHQTLNSVGG